MTTPAQPTDDLEYVAKVSHELRGPLHAILGLSELLIDGDLDGENLRLATSVHREARALGVMIDDLMDYGRISASRLTLVADVFSPAQLIADIVAGFRPSTDRKGLTLRIDVGPETPRWVTGDRGRYGQVVRNIIGNAVRYTPSGSIDVVVSGARDGAVTCAVTDTGIGIAEDMVQNLFEPFVQAQPGRFGGTGLGLAVSRRLADLMGGSLTVDSALGAGSTFTFVAPLPHAAPQSHHPHRPDGPTAPPVGTGAVLVVEDSPVNQTLATSQLTRLGFSATIAGSGEEALEILRDAGPANPFEVILMDWNLPGIDGLETTRRIRADDLVEATTPIIAITANALSGDREKCLEAGMTDFLSKPISLDDLRDGLNRCLGHRPIDTAAPAPTPRHNRSVDGTVLATLAEELGDPAVVETLVETFLAELPTRSTAITAGTNSNDFVSAQRAAHTLKSTAGLLGANRLAQLCTDLCSAEDEPVITKPLIDQIENEIADVASALRIHLHRGMEPDQPLVTRTTDGPTTHSSTNDSSTNDRKNQNR